MILKTKTLPDSIRAVLRGAEYHKPDITITAKPDGRSRLHSPYGDGFQTWATAVELSTGRILNTIRSSWGGNSMFSRGGMDALDRGREIEIPRGVVLVQGQHGGGHPASASIECHPDDLAPLLPPGSADQPTISRGAMVVLYALSAYKASYRREECNRHPGLQYLACQSELVEAGLAKSNKSGAIQITTAGKSMLATLSDNGPLPKYGPTPWDFKVVE